MKNIRIHQLVKVLRWASMSRNHFSMKSLSARIVVSGKTVPILPEECAEGTFDDISFDDFYRSLQYTKSKFDSIEADSLT